MGLLETNEQTHSYGRTFPAASRDWLRVPTTLSRAAARGTTAREVTRRALRAALRGSGFKIPDYARTHPNAR